MSNLLNNPCPSCGGKLLFSAEKQLLACNYCGYTENVNRDSDEVIEQELRAAVLKAQRFVPEKLGEHVLHCNSCGANVMTEKTTVEQECPFCASVQINIEAFEHNLIQPSGILPFQIPKKEAIGKFKVWISKGWFHPTKLKKMAALEDLNGIYIPFWTFDAQTRSNWSGEAGHYYYENQMVRVNGKMQTQRIQKTRWEQRSGQLSHFFDDVLVNASEGLGNPKFQRILTSYRLDEVINFDARLILGWRAEVYNVEVNAGYDIADKIMDARIRGMCISRLGGDTNRNLNINTDKNAQTFKHIILPVWVAAYRFNNKSYQFVINGQTGRVGGEKPYSWIKITIFALLIAAIIAMVFIVMGEVQ
ncbi:MAG: putative RNA-binding Zn-ribbon protein involved in translation (DUF1610 family) [Saprospiraceae bacterium]|jgi:predicted RNA-binding Zn-ribbon protein involved in translation (DUF1610 family)|tara:strand:+ start:272 stop:1354 length:1083 start_codon:yes stop_codon:yes gene_type:complete